MIVELKARVSVESRDEAIAIQNHINTYGTIPGWMALKLFRALAINRQALMQIGQSSQRGGFAIAAHAPKIMKFVNDIIKG